jgi:glyoxylase-like metal-dependent hydrolase (beta-lactamase superfamily II)
VRAVTGAHDALVPGRVTTVAPGFRRIVAPNPGPLTGPGTNTYLVGTGRVLVVDPGPASPAHLGAILGALGDASLAGILVTHTHADHSAGVAALAGARPAPVLARAPRVRTFHDPTFHATGSVADGDALGTDAGPLVAVVTPGHASNHVCWHAPGPRLLITGDHILGTTSPVILPPDGDMTEYLDSLARLAGLDLERLLPGHGPVLEAPYAVIEDLIRHRLEREARVVAALAAAGPAPLGALVPLAYADVDPSLYPWAQRTLEAHLIRLERDGRARRAGGHWSGA